MDRGAWPAAVQVKSSQVKSLSRVRLFSTPWTVAYQAPPGFSRQEYWSGLPFPWGLQKNQTQLSD